METARVAESALTEEGEEVEEEEEEGGEGRMRRRSLARHRSGHQSDCEAASFFNQSLLF